MVGGTSSRGIIFKDKEDFAQPTILAIYNPNATTKICLDASAYGLGGVTLPQQMHAQWRPVAYASKAMSETEQRCSD